MACETYERLIEFYIFVSYILYVYFCIHGIYIYIHTQIMYITLDAEPLSCLHAHLALSRLIKLAKVEGFIQAALSV